MSVEQATPPTHFIPWISVGDRLPTPFWTVAVWCTRSRIHMGEDYLDVGVYNNRSCVWQCNFGDHDEIVEVSHWIDLPGPTLPNLLPDQPVVAGSAI